MGIKSRLSSSFRSWLIWVFEGRRFSFGVTKKTLFLFVFYFDWYFFINEMKYHLSHIIKFRKQGSISFIRKVKSSYSFLTILWGLFENISQDRIIFLWTSSDLRWYEFQWKKKFWSSFFFKSQGECLETINHEIFWENIR